MRRAKNRTKLTAADRAVIVALHAYLVARKTYSAACALSNGLASIPPAIEAEQRAADRAWKSSHEEAIANLRRLCPLRASFVGLILLEERGAGEMECVAGVERAKREIRRTLKCAGRDPKTTMWSEITGESESEGGAS